MRNTLALPALAAFLVSPALAEPKPLRSAPGIRAEAGVFCSAEGMGRKPAPGTAAGWVNSPSDEPEFSWPTLTVPARIGVAFGVKAESTGGDLSGATLVVEHPAYRDGTTVESWSTNIHAGSPTVDFYSFDFDHELVPGPWRMQAQRDGRVLFDVTFDVVAPEESPEIVRLCAP
mgnify:CR=1 FL=1